MTANVSKNMVSILSAMIIFFAAINQSLRPLIEHGVSQLTDRSMEENENMNPIIVRSLAWLIRRSKDT
jgi:ABC-type uncharacterized transport system permease subunit